MKTALVALLLMAGSAEATPLDGVDAQTAEGWKQVTQPAGERGWMSASTPPLPARLPIGIDTPLVVYAYARRIGGVSDGEHIARPWAEISIGPRGEISRKQVGTALVNLGIQGVWPVMSSSLPTEAERAAALGWMLARRAGDTPAPVKKLYCAWARGNGVILKALPQSARDFIATLGCDPKAR